MFGNFLKYSGKSVHLNFVQLVVALLVSALSHFHSKIIPWLNIIQLCTAVPHSVIFICVKLNKPSTLTNVHTVYVAHCVNVIWNKPLHKCWVWISLSTVSFLNTCNILFSRYSNLILGMVHSSILTSVTFSCCDSSPVLQKD